jgi:hypothetical protein
MSMTRINKTGEPQVILESDGRLTISVPTGSSGAAGGNS